MSKEEEKTPVIPRPTPRINPTLFIIVLLIFFAVLAFTGWRFAGLRDVIFTVACILTFTAFGAALWYGPKLQVRHLWERDVEPQEIFGAENEARKTLAQILGGIFVLASLYFTWQNLDNTRRASDATLRNAEANQLTDRFTRAIDQLQSKNKEVRVGGIYALGRIAQTYEQEHWPVMQVLTTFVRERAPWQEQNTDIEEREQEKKAKSVPMPTPSREPVDIASVLPPNDIQAVMDVLRERKWERESDQQRIVLEATRLLKVSLRNAYMRRASFFGTDLSGANLNNAVLEEAVLNWTTLWMADLRNANLKRADLTRAKMRADTILDQADMEGTILSKTELYGVDLSKVKNLTWEQIEAEAFINCETKLPGELEQKKRSMLGCR